MAGDKSLPPGGETSYGTVVQNLRGDVVRVNKPSDAGQDNWAIRGQDFGPFGDRLSLWQQGPGAMPASDYGFTGREEDGSGLVFMRNRYYHPQLGRFISQDPIGFAGGLNLYAYCSNDPINFTDPLGLSPNDTLKVLGGGLYGAGDLLSFGMLSDPTLLIPGVRAAKMFGNGMETLKFAYHCGLSKTFEGLLSGLKNSMDFTDTSDPFEFGRRFMTAGLTEVTMAEGAAVAGKNLAGRAGLAEAEAGTWQAAEGEKVLRARHYTTNNGKKLIQESEKLIAKDQNKVFATSAKGKPMSPQDAETKLGIKPGHGNSLIEFNTTASEFDIVHNSITGFKEWVFRGDIDLKGRSPKYGR